MLCLNLCFLSGIYPESGGDSLPMKFQALLVATALAFSHQSIHATHYKLFILTGQSNSLGVTDGGEVDPTSGSDAADAHVIFSWHNRVDATTSLGHSGSGSTAELTTLKDQQGGVYAGSATHWGPEIEFARTLYRAGVRDFGVIKVSRGGGGNTLWHKGSSGHIYSRLHYPGRQWRSPELSLPGF